MYINDIHILMKNSNTKRDILKYYNVLKSGLSSMILYITKR